MTMKHVRNGSSSVRPYLCGPVELIALLESALGAKEVERHEFGPNSFHVELAVGDSAIALEAGDLPASVEPWTGSVYVYVEDVDASHARALNAGAREIAAPEDKPYGERQSGFIDMAGNTWWIGTMLE